MDRYKLIYLKCLLSVRYFIYGPAFHSLCNVFSLQDAENDFNFNCLLLQPSSSCSFDGSLKTDQSDSEPKWPEVPPVLNQNEDRRRTKYLRKDYLKVGACTCLTTTAINEMTTRNFLLDFLFVVFTELNGYISKYHKQSGLSG